MTTTPTNPEALIGRKIKGFKFEDNKHSGLHYAPEMDNYIGITGVIDGTDAEFNAFNVCYHGEGFWQYPADLISAHLIPEEADKAGTVETTIIFIVDGIHKSKPYTPIELLSKDAESVLEDMEVCTCSLNESSTMCEGDCVKFADSEITGYEVQSQADQKELVELKRKVEDQEAVIEGQAMRIGMYRGVDDRIESLEAEVFSEKEKSAKLVYAFKKIQDNPGVFIKVDSNFVDLSTYAKSAIKTYNQK